MKPSTSLKFTLAFSSESIHTFEVTLLFQVHLLLSAERANTLVKVNGRIGITEIDMGVWCEVGVKNYSFPICIAN